MNWLDWLNQRLDGIPGVVILFMLLAGGTVYIWAHRNWLRRRSDGFWVTAVILAIMVTSVVLAIFVIQRPEVKDWLIGDESGSTTIRNIGLLIGGIIAIALAVWRSRVSERQAATAERGLLNERYQKGAEMLGSEVLAVRMGGVDALHRLAKEHPQEYHVEIMFLFCAFARNPTKEDEIVTERVVSNVHFSMLRSDVQYVISAFRSRQDSDIDLEKRYKFSPRLHYANLRGAIITNTDFRGASFMGANLSGAYFANTRLESINFTDANLSGTQFSNVGEDPVTGLTQEQLDKAIADPDDPPKLIGVFDAETGRPLAWRGRPLSDDA